MPVCSIIVAGVLLLSFRSVDQSSSRCVWSDLAVELRLKVLVLSVKLVDHQDLKATKVRARS